MSLGTISAIGAFGAGSMGGVGGMAKILQFPIGVAKAGLAVEVANSPSSTEVNLSATAKSSAAADGVPAGQSMSDLAQALIVALLLQMLESKSVQ